MIVIIIRNFVHTAAFVQRCSSTCSDRARRWQRISTKMATLKETTNRTDGNQNKTEIFITIIA